MRLDRTHDFRATGRFVLLAASVACSSGSSKGGPVDASTHDTSTPGGGQDSAAPRRDARPNDAAPKDAGVASSSDASDGGFAAGSDTTEIIDIGDAGPAGDAGRERTFIVHLPTGYTGTTPVPLVFDYHPLGITAAFWKLATNWSATADKYGFIMVWPQGVDDAWNVGRCCGDADDVAFTRAIVAKLATQISFDPKRIYATGCSNGGGMSYMIACNAADLIAAVAPVDFDCITGDASVPSCGSCTPSRPISECQFRGTDDMDVPYDGGPTGVVPGLIFPGAEQNFKTWAGIDDCTGSPAPDPSQSACQTYSTCAGDADVTLCTIVNGTHCGSYTLFPIVETAWASFQQHSLP